MRRLPLLVILAAVAACGSSRSADLTTVVVGTGQAARELVLEVADTPAARREGLMHREALPEGVDGMLFVFDRARPQAMWMKNTQISLDILFVDRAGRVTTIYRRTEPYSEQTLPSEGPAKAAIEVLAGRARTLGISVGDRVRHAVFEMPGDG